MELQNPIDVLGVHPGGALLRPIDERDYKSSSPEIGSASAPFDWNVGYDVEKDLGYTAPTKDQGQAGSCGGETVSQEGQAISLAYLGENSEKSAKAPYSQVYVPGGGSNSRMLADIYAKQGIYKESLVPSYINGQPPSEAFMEMPWDITISARADAAKSAGLFAYAFPDLMIDAIAQAMRDHKGILIGIHGSNNGTWLTNKPSPKQVGSLWAHFMFGGKANLVNGVKTLWLKQSWGKTVAPDTNAWQMIDETHFDAGRIWDAMHFVYSPKPATVAHVFTTGILYGQTSAEVTALQTVLIHDRDFNLAPTGYFGDITATAVLKFRAKHGVSSATDPKGHSVGPATRAALNALPS